MTHVTFTHFSFTIVSHTSTPNFKELLSYHVPTMCRKVEIQKYLVDRTSAYHPVITEIVAVTLQCVLGSAERNVMLRKASIPQVCPSVYSLLMEDEGSSRSEERLDLSVQGQLKPLGLWFHGRLLK